MDTVADKFGPDGRDRHAFARLRELLPAAFVPLPQSAMALRMMVPRHAERDGDRLRGDVVMRRTDAAGGEDIVVPRAQRVDGRNDLRLDVGHDAHLPQLDADLVQPVAEEGDVPVLGAAG